uniref:Uncharacterized protein n=1 Tax=Anguilla anguilla TaxID=7936 RepID=A0A0E9X6S7_ANGAN
MGIVNLSPLHLLFHLNLNTVYFSLNVSLDCFNINISLRVHRYQR